jgi:hypothetical protein
VLGSSKPQPPPPLHTQRRGCEVSIEATPGLLVALAKAQHDYRSADEEDHTEGSERLDALGDVLVVQRPQATSMPSFCKAEEWPFRGAAPLHPRVVEEGPHTQASAQAGRGRSPPPQPLPSRLPEPVKPPGDAAEVALPVRVETVQVHLAPVLPPHGTVRVDTPVNPVISGPPVMAPAQSAASLFRADAPAPPPPGVARHVNMPFSASQELDPLLASLQRRQPQPMTRKYVGGALQGKALSSGSAPPDVSAGPAPFLSAFSPGSEELLGCTVGSTLAGNGVAPSHPALASSNSSPLERSAEPLWARDREGSVFPGRQPSSSPVPRPVFVRLEQSGSPGLPSAPGSFSDPHVLLQPLSPRQGPGLSSELAALKFKVQQTGRLRSLRSAEVACLGSAAMSFESWMVAVAKPQPVALVVAPSLPSRLPKELDAGNLPGLLSTVQDFVAAERSSNFGRS